MRARSQKAQRSTVQQQKRLRSSVTLTSFFNSINGKIIGIVSHHLGVRRCQTVLKGTSVTHEPHIGIIHLRMWNYATPGEVVYPGIWCIIRRTSSCTIDMVNTARGGTMGKNKEVEDVICVSTIAGVHPPPQPRESSSLADAGSSDNTAGWNVVIHGRAEAPRVQSSKISLREVFSERQRRYQRR